MPGTKKAVSSIPSFVICKDCLSLRAKNDQQKAVCRAMEAPGFGFLK
jgi:hypothetical protein